MYKYYLDVLIRLLIILFVLFVIYGLSVYFWADIQPLLANYNIELGGVGSLVTIGVAIFGLLAWVFKPEKKLKGTTSFFAGRDVVNGNKTENHHYK